MSIHSFIPIFSFTLQVLIDLTLDKLTDHSSGSPYLNARTKTTPFTRTFKVYRRFRR